MAYSTSTIAQGCFGKVYKQKYNDTWAAVKKVPQQLISRKDLERECEVYNKSNHPNIVKLLGNIDLREGKWIIPLEFIFGEDLETTIFKASKSKMQLTPSIKGTIITGMCEGLLHLHSKDIVHQDLKPENIMVEHNTNRAVIIDLGLAKFFRYGLNSAIDMGNEAYAAPEVLQRGIQRDQRSDVWAMGKIIAELCARIRLFTPTVCPTKIKETLKDQPYCHVVCRMVEPDPSLRASLGGVMSEIRRINANEQASNIGGAGIVTNNPVKKDQLKPSSPHIRNMSPSPVDRDASPVNRDPSPMNRDPTPVKKAPSPFNRDPTPMNKAPSPFNRDPTPMNKAPSPFNRDPTPMNKVPTPFNRDPTPMNKAPTPFNRDPTPMNRAPSPFNRHLTPMNRAPSPFNTDPTPMNRAPSPFNTDPTPMNRAPSPFNTDPTPMNRVPSPFNKDPTPINRVPSPFNKDPTPINRVPSPFNKDPTPMNRVPSPFNKDPTPMNRVPSPFNKDPTPMNKGPTPFNRHLTPMNRAPSPFNRDPTAVPPSSQRTEDKNKNQALVPTGRSELTQDFTKTKFFQEAAQDLPYNLPTTGRVVVRSYQMKNGEVETWEQKEVVTRDGKIVKFDDVKFNSK